MHTTKLQNSSSPFHLHSSPIYGCINCFTSLCLYCYWHFFLHSISKHSTIFPSLIPDLASCIIFKLLVVMNCVSVTAIADFFFYFLLKNHLSCSLPSEGCCQRRCVTVSQTLLVSRTCWIILNYLAKRPYHVREGESIM